LFAAIFHALNQTFRCSQFGFSPLTFGFRRAAARQRSFSPGSLIFRLSCDIPDLCSFKRDRAISERNYEISKDFGVVFCPLPERRNGAGPGDK
jgi:hypothetical protein